MTAFTRVAKNVATTVRTSTGTQDFTYAGLGTPAGFHIVVSWATSLSGTTHRAGGGASWGVCDGTNQRCSWYAAIDNSSTQISASGGSRSLVAKLSDPSDGSTALTISFDQWITDGVRLSIDSTNGDAFQMFIVLLGGTDVETLAFDELADTSGVKVTTDFLTDFVWTNRMKTTDGSLNGEGRFDPGIATRLNPTDGVSCIRIASDTSASTAEGRRGKYSDRLTSFLALNEGIGGSDVEGGAITIDNYVSDGFDVVSATMTSARICGLAVKWGGSGTVAQDVDEVSPGSTGDQNRTWPTFETGFIYTAFSACSNDNALQNGAGGGCGASDMTTQRACALHDQNNVGTTNSGSKMADNVIDTHNGAADTRLMAASTNGRLSTGFVLNWGVVDAGTPRRYSVLALDYVPISTEPAVQAGAATTAFSAQRVVQASVAVQASSATVSINADEVKQAAVSVSASAATATIDADEVRQTTVTVSAGAATVTIDADEIKQADVALQADAAATTISAQKIHQIVVAVQASVATVTVDVDSIKHSSLTVQADVATASILGQRISQTSVTAQASIATASIDGTVIQVEATIDASADAATAAVVAQKVIQASVAVQAAPATTSIDTSSVKQTSIAVSAAAATVSVDLDRVIQSGVTLTAEAATASVSGSRVLQPTLAVQADAATASVSSQKVSQSSVVAQASGATTSIGTSSITQTDVAAAASAATVTVDADKVVQTALTVQADAATTAVSGDVGNIVTASVALQADAATTAVAGQKVARTSIAAQAAVATVTVDLDRVTQAAIAVQADAASTTIAAQRVVQTDAAFQADAAVTAIAGIVTQVITDVAVQADAATALATAQRISQTSVTAQADFATTTASGQKVIQTAISVQAGAAVTEIQVSIGEIMLSDIAVVAQPATAQVRAQRVVQTAITLQARPARAHATDSAFNLQPEPPTVVFVPERGSVLSLPPPTVVILEPRTHPAVTGGVTVLFEKPRAPALPVVVTTGIALQASPATAAIVGVVL